MNKKRILLAILLLLLLAAGFVIWQRRPIRTSMRLALTGTPGLKVAGTVVVDGVPQEFSGVLSANITAKARKFDYTILMQEPHGELHGELTVANGIYGSSSSARTISPGSKAAITIHGSAKGE